VHDTRPPGRTAGLQQGRIGWEGHCRTPLKETGKKLQKEIREEKPHNGVSRGGCKKTSVWGKKKKKGAKKIAPRMSEARRYRCSPLAAWKLVVKMGKKGINHPDRQAGVCWGASTEEHQLGKHH